MAQVAAKKPTARPSPNPVGDLVISGTQLGVGVTDSLSTFTVQSRAHFALTGHVTKTQGDATLTGIGTAFDTELVVGDRIAVPDQTEPGDPEIATVIFITSATSLTVDIPFKRTETVPQIATARPSLARFDDANQTQRVIVNDAGFVGIDTVFPRAPLDVAGVACAEQIGVGVTDNLSTFTVQSRAHVNLTGTVTTAQGSATITGTGTKFQSELLIGDRISIPDTSPGASEAGTVIAIASDTSLTVDQPFLNIYTNETAIGRPSLARFDDQDGSQCVIVNDKGFTGIGTLAPQAVLHVVGNDNDYSDPQYGECPVTIRSHSDEQNDSWNMVMSYGTANGAPGVALWTGDGAGGYPSLNFDFHDENGVVGPSVRMDINGIEQNGSVVVCPTVITANYTVASNDQYIYADASGGAITVTLPAFADNHGKVLWIFKVDGANAVSIAPGSGDKINGASSAVTIAAGAQWSGVKLVAVTNGSNFNTWVATGLPAL